MTAFRFVTIFASCCKNSSYPSTALPWRFFKSGYPMPTVAILEDNNEALSVMRRALSTPDTLNSQWDIVFHTDLCETMIDWFKTHQADVFISDLGLPDQSGLEAVKKCKKLHPETEIIVCSVFDDDMHLFESLKLGANGYLLKADIDVSLNASLQQLMDGGSPMSPRIARRVLLQLHPPVAPELEQPSLLTPKELQVLALIARGFKYSEIATLQNLSTHTVHSHLKNIYKKLQVSSKSEAIYEARLSKYID
jgi:DNA-binding NarL/FixJ family response regulator